HPASKKATAKQRERDGQGWYTTEKEECAWQLPSESSTQQQQQSRSFAIAEMKLSKHNRAVGGRESAVMSEPRLKRRAGCKRARRTTAVSIAMRAVLVLLMGAPHIPTLDALKLSSISEERGHLGVGLLRAVEVVRGRYERAWTLVSAPDPTAEDLDTALELLQENAQQWESLEPAVKLWTERDN
ncbi:unnamed protein product, partial [Ectocarpus sp. 13 AM-2016]